MATQYIKKDKKTVSKIKCSINGCFKFLTEMELFAGDGKCFSCTREQKKITEDEEKRNKENTI